MSPRTHLMPPALRDAFRTFAFALVGDLPAVVAGGFAAEWTLAQDLDLFMFGDPTLAKTCHQLHQQGVEYARASVLYTGENRPVIMLQTPLLPIHLIGCVETDYHALLDTFDISTHRWAVTKSGVHLRGNDATTVFEPGRVLVPHRLTASRVEKLQDRYQIEIAPYEPPPATASKSSKKGSKAA